MDQFTKYLIEADPRKPGQVSRFRKDHSKTVTNMLIAVDRLEAAVADARKIIPSEGQYIADRQKEIRDLRGELDGVWRSVMQHLNRK